MTLPELPWVREERYTSIGLKLSDAQYITQTKERSDFFDEVIRLARNQDEIKLAANYVVSELAGWYAKNDVREFSNISPTAFLEVITLIGEGRLSSRGAKDLYLHILTSGGEPHKVMLELGLEQVQDEGMLREVVERVATLHPEVVAELRQGKEALLQFLVGQAMKESKGSGNPAEFQRLFRELL